MNKKYKCTRCGKEFHTWDEGVKKHFEQVHPKVWEDYCKHALDGVNMQYYEEKSLNG